MPKLTWHTEQRPIGELVEWEKNPRQLTTHEAAHLKKSLEGFTPELVDSIQTLTNAKP